LLDYGGRVEYLDPAFSEVFSSRGRKKLGKTTVEKTRK